MGRPRSSLLLFGASALVLGCAPDGERDLRLHDTARLGQAQRPDTPNSSELWRYAPGDVVERYGTPEGNFVIHFTREGPHAVPLRDADDDGVPDHVQDVGALYEEALAFYTEELGFRPPLSDEDVPDGNGGDGRYDVYLLDFSLSADGAFRREACLNENPRVCTGYLVQENDFAGYAYPSVAYANTLLASHELFHFVQAAYDNQQDSVLSEGTAVWASEKFAAFLNDLEGFSFGFLSSPDRSLNVPQPGPVDHFSYGAGVFFQFLEERYSRDIVRELWEAVADNPMGAEAPDWFEHGLDEVLAAYGATFEEMYRDLVRWNLHTGPRADASVSYANGQRYAPVAMRSVTAPYVDERLRVFYASAQYYTAPPRGRAAMTAALVGDEEDLRGLHLMLATLDGAGRVSALSDADVASAELELSTQGASAFLAVVVNTTKGGDSRRPGLCLGTPDEVEECRADLLKEKAPPEGDAGPVGPDDEPPEGCGCATTSAAQPWYMPSWLALLGLSALGWRRIRRRRR